MTKFFFRPSIPQDFWRVSKMIGEFSRRGHFNHGFAIANTFPQFSHAVSSNVAQGKAGAIYRSIQILDGEVIGCFLIRPIIIEEYPNEWSQGLRKIEDRIFEISVFCVADRWQEFGVGRAALKECLSIVAQKNPLSLIARTHSVSTRMEKLLSLNSFELIHRDERVGVWEYSYQVK